jgi:redox-sensing transcriptional repressor
MEKCLPVNTVVRLSRYRRLLEKYRYMDEPYIFSHDLARMLGLKAVKVRHDLMLLGISGDRRMGYSVNTLLEKIAETIQRPGQKVILVGLGRLGMSLAAYLRDAGAGITIAAAFDIDPAKLNRSCEGIPCYGIQELTAYIRENDAKIAILAIPPEDVADILPLLLDAGIRGILNYTSEHIHVPEDVFVRNVDMVSFLEEIAYFIC